MFFLKTFPQKVLKKILQSKQQWSAAYLSQVSPSKGPAAQSSLEYICCFPIFILDTIFYYQFQTHETSNVKTNSNQTHNLYQQNYN